MTLPLGSFYLPPISRLVPMGTANSSLTPEFTLVLVTFFVLNQFSSYSSFVCELHCRFGFLLHFSVSVVSLFSSYSWCVYLSLSLLLGFVFPQSILWLTNSGLLLLPLFGFHSNILRSKVVWLCVSFFFGHGVACFCCVWLRIIPMPFSH